MGGWTEKVASPRRSLSSQHKSKFGPTAAHLHRKLLRLVSPLAQVYGLFEGMLEKLELEDDGEC